MAGIIGSSNNTSNSTLTNWLNECVYQLAMIKSDNSDVNSISSAARRNITVQSLAIVVKFENGPPVILGGKSTDWSLGDGSFTNSNFDDLADSIVGDTSTDRYVKFSKDTVGIIGVVGATHELETDFRAKADENLATFWTKVDATDNHSITDEQGAGWGVTVGTLTPTYGTTGQGGADYDAGTILINHPEAYTGSGVQGGVPVDTVLFKRESGSGSNAWTVQGSGQWGTQEEGGSNFAYNYGKLSTIQLYIRNSGSVLKEGGAAGNNWAQGWYSLIDYDLVANDSVTEDTVASTLDSTEEISKLGWYGPTDKPLTASDSPNDLDLNDGIQDVRLRFSLKGRDSDGGSSGSWAPKNLLNWAFRQGQTENFTSDTLLPSRVSILSRNTPFLAGGYDGDGTGTRYYGTEVITSLHSQNANVPDSLNYPANSDFHRWSGSDKVLAIEHGSDASYLEQNGIMMIQETDGPKIVILTDILRAGLDDLVANQASNDLTASVVSSMKVGNTDPANHVAFLSKYLTGESSTTNHLDIDLGNEYNIKSFENQLTLVLFDPSMWWSSITNVPAGSNTRGDFGRFDNDAFNFKMVLPFQPHADFTKNDKLKISVPLGNSIAQ